MRMKNLIRAVTAAAVLLGCAACGSGRAGKEAVMPENGYAEGRIGDAMRTAWFDFTVNKAELTDQYGSVTANEGEKLLVVNVTLTSTVDQEIVMYDTDFQAQWGTFKEDDYRYPVTFENEAAPEKEMLATEYTLEPEKSVTGDLVFSVPGGKDRYSLFFMEYYETPDDPEAPDSGDLFFVFFEV